MLFSQRHLYSESEVTLVVMWARIYIFKTSNNNRNTISQVSPDMWLKGHITQDSGHHVKIFQNELKVEIYSRV